MIKYPRLFFLSLLLGATVLVGCWGDSKPVTNEPIPDVPPATRGTPGASRMGDNIAPSPPAPR
jgi:hypothetical protein